MAIALARFLITGPAAMSGLYQQNRGFSSRTLIMQCQRKLFRFGKLGKGLSLSGSYFRPFRFGPHFASSLTLTLTLF
jgi:hypothetical protein